MDQARMGEALFRLRHRHGDGSWADLSEVRPHHDPADHDPERSWIAARRFRCTSCDEEVVVAAEDDARPGQPQ